MMRHLLLLILPVFALLHAAAAGAYPFPDPTPRVEILVPDTLNPNDPTCDWKPVDTGKPDQVASADFIRRIMSRSFAVKRVFADAFSRLDDFHKLPTSERWLVSENTKITVLI